MWAICEFLNLPEYSMPFTLWLTQVKYGGKTLTCMTGYHTQAFRVPLWKTHGVWLCAVLWERAELGAALEALGVLS